MGRWRPEGPPDRLPQLIQYLLIRIRQSARRMRRMRGAEGSAFRGQIVYSPIRVYVYRSWKNIILDDMPGQTWYGKASIIKAKRLVM